MKIDVPDSIIADLIDANIIQCHGSINTVEMRSQMSTRLQWHFAEYVTALIAKELKNDSKKITTSWRGNKS